MFNRNLDGNLIDSLKRTELFKKLKADIQKHEVFPAIRDNTIQFYYKGSRMFIYDKYGFATHYKYLINNAKDGNKYICSADGKTTIDDRGFIVNDFCEGYDSIKQNIGIYAKPEAKLTSGFYSKSFFDPSVKDNYYLFDIEAAFAKQNKNKFDCEEQEQKKKERTGTDRVDAVFFDKSKGSIVFCEVKRFDDSRVLEKNGKIEVINQLDRYKNQIEKRYDEILNAYKNAMVIYNKLFDTDIFEIKGIYPQAWLFVTGYPQGLKAEVETSIVLKIKDHGYKVHLAKSASGTALIKMCKNSK